MGYPLGKEALFRGRPFRGRTPTETSRFWSPEKRPNFRIEISSYLEAKLRFCACSLARAPRHPHKRLEGRKEGRKQGRNDDVQMNQKKGRKEGSEGGREGGREGEGLV